MALSLLANLNLIAFYGFTGYTDRLVVNGLDATVVLAFFNCAAFVGAWWWTIRAVAKRSADDGTQMRGGRVISVSS